MKVNGHPSPAQGAKVAKGKSAKAEKAAADSYSPSEFGQAHSALLQSTLDPVAKSIKATALSNRGGSKLGPEIDKQIRAGNATLAMLGDNLKTCQEAQSGAIKLNDLYALDGQLAQTAAEQASRTSGGDLNPDSARFLPLDLRADYEHLSGLKISDKPGIGTEGVTVEDKGKVVNVNINFDKALEGATAHAVVLAVTQDLTVEAHKVPTNDDSLAPYWITIQPREGKVPDGCRLQAESGNSGFDDPRNGHLIDAGKTVTVGLMAGFNDDKAYKTYNFQLDKVNEYDVPDKKPTEKTQGVRESWESHFSSQAGFSLDGLESRSLADVRDQPGIKVMFDAIRATTDRKISYLAKHGLLEFAVDKDSNSLGALLRFEDSKKQSLCLLDLEKGKWVGHWSFDGSGNKEWKER